MSLKRRISFALLVGALSGTLAACLTRPGIALAQTVSGMVQGVLANGTANVVNLRPILMGGSNAGTLRNLAIDAQGDLLVSTPVPPVFSTSIGVLNGTAPYNLTSVGGSTTFAVSATGTWTGTLTFETSADGSTWTACSAFPVGNLSQSVTTTTANGSWFVNNVGVMQFRLRMSAYTSGSAVVALTSAGVAGSLELLTDPTGIQHVQLGDPSGRTVLGDTTKVTYSVAVASFTPANTANADLVRITGSGTKTVKLRQVGFGCVQASVTTLNPVFIKRSTNDTAGTFVGDTAVPLDSANAAATVTVGHYTAAPTTGTAVGNVRSVQWSASFGTYWTVYDCTNSRAAQPVTLRGSAEELDINMGPTAPGASAGMTYFIEWTEE